MGDAAQSSPAARLGASAFARMNEDDGENDGEDDGENEQGGGIGEVDGLA